MIKKDPIGDLDKYLSCYLNQFRAGAIEIQDDTKLPTFLHFAVKYEMKELIKTLLNLPGGPQMATMTNSDGLNARDLAVHSGNLELANLLKDPKIPRQNYEFPVLKSKRSSQEEEQYLSSDFNSTAAVLDDLSIRESQQKLDYLNNQNEDEYLYDIPRKVEQCYVVPPAPRPVEKFKMKYVTMTPRSPQDPIIPLPGVPPPLPQSRHELLSDLRKSSSIEEILPEPEKQPLQPPQPPSRPVNVSIDNSEANSSEPPKSPLLDTCIVNPFPLTYVPQNEQKSSAQAKDRLKTELSQVQSQLIKGQISLVEAENKFEEWKASLLYTLVTETEPTAVAQLSKQWEKMLTSAQKNADESTLKIDQSNEKSLRKKFTKLIKSGGKKKNADSKYSTLPSMPLRLKNRHKSATSVPTVVSPAESQPDMLLRNKSCSISVSETGSRHSDSDSTCSSAAFEKHDLNISD